MAELEQVKVVSIDEFQKQLAEKEKQQPENVVVTEEKKEEDTPSGTETTEKVETAPEEVQEEKINSLFDKLKEEPKPEPEPNQLSEDVLKKLQDYEAYRLKVEQYESNPLVKALELGKLDEVAKKIAGVDTSKMSIEQMLETKIKNEFNSDPFTIRQQVTGSLKVPTATQVGTKATGVKSNTGGGNKTFKIKGKDYGYDKVKAAADASGMTIEEYVTEANK